AWIVLLDGEGNLTHSAQSKWGKKFRPFIEMIKEGTIPDCGEAALKKNGVVLWDSTACRNCPLKDTISVYNYLNSALRAHGNIYGLIGVSLSERIVVDETEEDLFRELAGDIAFALYDLDQEDERRRLTETVQKSEEQYRTLTESAQDSIFVIGRDDKIEYVNTFGAAQFGKQPADLIGKPRAALFPPQIAERQHKYLKKVFKTGERIIRENVSQFGKRTVWLNTILVPLKDSQGKVRAVMGVSRDITEQKKAERELEESEARFKTLSESAAEAIAIHDKGVILDVNSTYCQLFGYERKEVIGRSVLDFAAPESKDLVLKNVKRGYQKPYEAVGLRKDGSTFIGELIGKPIPYKGRTVRATVIRDITDRKRMERTLQLIVEGTSATTGVGFFKDLVRSIARVLETDIAFITRRDPTNPQLVRTLALWQNGQIRENIEWEIEGTPCELVIKGKSVVIPRNVQQKFPKDTMLKEVNAEGYLAVPIRDADGNVVGHLGTLDSKPLEYPEKLENIMQIFAIRAGTELQRLQSEEELGSVFASNPLPILTLDEDRIVQNSNAAAQEYCQMVAEEIAGQRVGDVLLCLHRLDDPKGCGFGPDCEHCITRNTVLDTFSDQQTRQGIESEMSLLVDGEPTSRTIRLNTSYFDSLLGPRVMVMFDDITEQKQNRDEILRLKEFNENIITGMAEGIVVMDAEGIMEYVNPAVVGMLGYSRKELEGQHWSLIIPEDQHPIVNAVD
ncbi:MAG: PAS domain S-box protein, partial [Fidelibacterota bacterium]